MTNLNPPLPPSVAACRGLSPDARDSLIGVAKAIAPRFCWAVKSRSAAEVERVTRDMGRDQWAALAVVLAEGIQPGSLRLAQVARTAEDEAPRGEVA